MRNSKSWQVRDVGWLFFLVLVVNAALTGFTIFYVSAKQRDVRVNLDIVGCLNEVMMTVLQADNTVSGYLLTRGKSNLQPLADARIAINEQLDSLGKLLVEQEPTVALRQLSGDTSSKFSALNELVKQFDTEQRIGPEGEALMGRGRALTKQIRQQIGDLIEKEHERLHQQDKTVRQGITLSVIATAFGDFVAIAMLGLVFYMFRRESQIERRGQASVEAARAEVISAQRESADAFALLDTFFMNAPLGLAFFDKDLRFIRINRYLAEANQVPAAECVGKTLHDLSPEAVSTASEDLQKVMATGMAVLDRIVTQDPRGHIGTGPVWQSSCYPVRDAGGTLIGVGYVTRDITERLRDELKLKQSEERFRVLAETLPQIVWVARPNGELEFVNQRWLDYTGLNIADSHMTSWLKPLHPEDRPATEQSWKQSLSKNQPFEFEFRMRRSDGQVRWFLGRALPIFGDSGHISRWFGTCTDIDSQIRAQEELEQRVSERTVELQNVVATLHDEAQEREKATEQLRIATEELSRSNRELEQFAYVASHDLQEPLRKIQAFGDRLTARCVDRLDEQGKEYVNRMINAAVRMRHLINDLLAFSRITTKQQPFGPVDLNEVVQEVLSDLEERIISSGAKLEIDQLPTIDADRLQMRQLFQNLVANALKFHKPEMAPHVEIRYERLNDFSRGSEDGIPKPAARIAIRDHGVGFDDAYAGRLFQLFQRLHSRTQYEGTGIGLAVCRKIVERHGGTIAARGQPGEGATMTVILPEQQGNEIGEAGEASNNLDGR